MSWAKFKNKFIPPEVAGPSSCLFCTVTFGDRQSGRLKIDFSFLGAETAWWQVLLPPLPGRTTTLGRGRECAPAVVYRWEWGQISVGLVLFIRGQIPEGFSGNQIVGRERLATVEIGWMMIAQKWDPAPASQNVCSRELWRRYAGWLCKCSSNLRIKWPLFFLEQRNTICFLMKVMNCLCRI